VNGRFGPIWGSQERRIIPVSDHARLLGRPRRVPAKDPHERDLRRPRSELAKCDPDAGIVQSCCDVSGPPTWHCFDGPPYCATNHPSVGDPCTHEGDSCAITSAVECGQTTLRCTGGTWLAPFDTCPVSTARAKRDISYLGPDDVLRLRDPLLGVKLATYKYKLGDPSEHLGFIIEDTPSGSPAGLASRERVDLYGYLSMAVAAIQQQQRQIHLLEQRLERVEHGRCKEPYLRWCGRGPAGRTRRPYPDLPVAYRRQ
jgi:hypothetical protein